LSAPPRAYTAQGRRFFKAVCLVAVQSSIYFNVNVHKPTPPPVFGRRFIMARMSGGMWKGGLILEREYAIFSGSGKKTGKSLGLPAKARISGV